MSCIRGWNIKSSLYELKSKSSNGVNILRLDINTNQKEPALHGTNEGFEMASPDT